MTACLRWPAGGDGYAACSWEFENFSDWEAGRSGSGGRRDVQSEDLYRDGGYMSGCLSGGGIRKNQGTCVYAGSLFLCLNILIGESV